MLASSVIASATGARHASVVQGTVDEILSQGRARPEASICFFRHRVVFINNVLLPGTAGIFVIGFPENIVEGKRIYFIETDRQLIAKLRERPQSRIADLVLTPEEAAALMRTPRGELAVMCDVQDNGVGQAGNE